MNQKPLVIGGVVGLVLGLIISPMFFQGTGYRGGGDE